MFSRKRPRVSSATGTWTPRKRARTNNRFAARSSGLRTGGWRGVPGRRGELKYIDNSAAGQVDADNVYVITLLNGIAPGTGASQRIGKKINMKTMQLRLIASATSAGAVPFQGVVRVMLIYDTQTNAFSATAGLIFENTSTGLSPINMDNRDRFKVLASKSLRIDQNGGNPSAYFDIYKRLKMPTIYNAGTAGTVGDITTGALYLVVTSASGTLAAATNSINYDFYSRIRYDDS